MKTHSCLFIMCFLLAAPAFLLAQTAYEMQNLLQTQAVSYEQAAWFVLEAANVPGDSNRSKKSKEEAFRFAAEQRWLPSNANPSKQINLQRVSLLIMRAFGIKGGLMYTVSKSSHYAYREMVYQDIIQGRADPRMAVSGELLLFLVERVLYRMDDDPWVPPEETEEEEGLYPVEKINAQFDALALDNVFARIVKEGVVVSFSSIQSLANSAEVPENEKKILREIVRILKTVSAQKIIVIGYTALAGNEKNQRQAALEHSQAVADYLVAIGAQKAVELIIESHGPQQSPANNNASDKKAFYRRIEIVVLEDQ